MNKAKRTLDGRLKADLPEPTHVVTPLKAPGGRAGAHSPSYQNPGSRCSPKTRAAREAEEAARNKKVTVRVADLMAPGRAKRRAKR